MVQDLDAATFLADFLSLQRPVLIKGALNHPSWELVKKRYDISYMCTSCVRPDV